MSTRLKLLLSLLVLTAPACVQSDEAQVVPFSEWRTLPNDCSALLAAARDEEIFIALTEQREDGVVLETASQACVTSSEQLARRASADGRYELLRHIHALFAMGDPSPHPDEPTGASEREPSPHPDAQRGPRSDPSPHPDRDDDASVSALVIKSIGLIPRGSPNMGNDAAPSEPASAGSRD
jgi:hypothetical protein